MIENMTLLVDIYTLKRRLGWPEVKLSLLLCLNVLYSTGLLNLLMLWCHFCCYRSECWSSFSLSVVLHCCMVELWPQHDAVPSTGREQLLHFVGILTTYVVCDES